jgi:hypothetical protein
VVSRTFAAACCALSAASRPSSTACDCSSSAVQPAWSPNRSSGPSSPPCAPEDLSVCSSRWRDSASASNAGAEPRTAAPACSGMFCESADSVAKLSRKRARSPADFATNTSASPASSAEASATPIVTGKSLAASMRFLVSVITGPRPSPPWFRKPPPAGTAGSRAGCGC